MSGNRFGTFFQYTTWGESHGPAIGCVIDGVPPRLPLSETDIQLYLDQRKPGQSKFTTQRQEPDQVRILSGVFDGLTTGAPISLIIDNVDAKSKDYSDIADKYRPGHADFTYDAKYGIRDYRGGGRASARETACRVAAGAVARKILRAQINDAITIRGAVVQVGPHAIDRSRFDWGQVGENPFWCPDAGMVDTWAKYIDDKRLAGSSTGAIVEVVASGIPAGLGAPVVDKLDAAIAGAMMSINAVKGVEIGAGFSSVLMGGEDNSDAIRMVNGVPQFQTNHAGGILGGISTGQDIVVRIAFKPTSSVLSPVATINKAGENTDIVTKGRHDPCVGLRGTPVAEAMLANVLADAWFKHKAQCR